MNGSKLGTFIIAAVAGIFGGLFVYGILATGTAPATDTTTDTEPTHIRLDSGSAFVTSGEYLVEVPDGFCALLSLHVPDEGAEADQFIYTIPLND